MKLSVVTISFNQARFLEAAIRSVLDQGIDNLEYIIIDPGSTDGSRALIERHRHRFARVILEPDAGPADGLNRGFAAATGAIYAFLNADDVLRPGALAQALAAFARHPEADVISGHGHLIDEAGLPIRRYYSDRFGLWRFLRGGAVLLQQSTFFRAAAFHAVGGFNPANRTCWDGELWLDLALAGARFRRVDAFWSGYRVYDGSITASIARASAWRRAYLADQRRLYEKATGRPPGATFGLQQAAARCVKWSASPIALSWRLASLLDARARRSPV